MSSAQDLTTLVLDGRYRLTRLMGEGGMGQVYEGIHELLDRKVAVKVLLPRYAFEPKFRERFLREAKAASKVRHPNVVQILDFGETPNGSVYFAMEFLEGRDLASLLRQEGPLPWPRARHLLLQMTSALGVAHEHRIIHRDIKPANFFVMEARGHQEFVKVLDFGIAKIAAEPGGEDTSQAQSLTGTGEVYGTAKYMAPEQAFGSSDDPRVDVYSLGIVAYEMLTGTAPFKGSSVFEIITRHVNDRPRPPRTLVPEIPEAVEAAILRAIAKRPDERFGSMDELGRALHAIDGEAGAMAAMPIGHSRPLPSAVMQPVQPAVPPTPVAAPVAAAPVVVTAPAPVVQAGVVRPRAPAPGGLGIAPGSGMAPPVEEGPRGHVTSVVPTRLKAPSSVTAGELEPTTGRPGVAAPPAAPLPRGAPGMEEPAVGSSTSPLRGMGDVGSATGPEDPRGSSSQWAGTESFSPMTGPHATAPRSKALVIGLLTALVTGAGVVAGVIASSGSDVPSPAVAAAGPNEPAAPAVIEVVAPPVPADPDAEAVEPVVEPVAEPGEPSPEPVVEEPSPSPPEPGPEPKPTPRPKEPTKPKSSPKASAPLTDAQVESKLARSLEKKCREHGSGTTVSVELLVGSDGRVLTKKAPGATGALSKCLLDEAAKAKFPTGTTRKASVRVAL